MTEFLLSQRLRDGNDFVGGTSPLTLSLRDVVIVVH